MELILEQAQFLVAADEGRLEGLAAVLAAAVSDDAQSAVGGHRRGLAFQFLGTDRFKGDRRLGGIHRRLSHQYRARWSDRLQPAGGVDHVAGDHALALGPDGHGSVAGDDAGARRNALAQAVRGVDQFERGPHRALGVVLVGGRCAPHRHYGVADELLDRPAVALHRQPREAEVAIERLAYLLCVAFLGEGREADQVDEQDGHETSLCRRRRSV